MDALERFIMTTHAFENVMTCMNNKKGILILRRNDKLSSCAFYTPTGTSTILIIKGFRGIMPCDNTVVICTYAIEIKGKRCWICLRKRYSVVQ